MSLIGPMCSCEDGIGFAFPGRPCAIHGSDLNRMQTDATQAAVQRLSADNARLRTLLADLVGHEDGPCSFDHHGYCQEHGMVGGTGHCAVRAAREELGLDP